MEIGDAQIQMAVDGLALHNKSNRQKQGDIYHLCTPHPHPHPHQALFCGKKKSPDFIYDLCVGSYFSKSMKYSLHFES